MKRFLHKFSLKSILPDDAPTFHSNNGQFSSQIDHILYHVSQESEISIKFDEQLCQLESTTNLSTHDTIIASIPLTLKKTNDTIEKHSNNYTDFIVKKLKWHVDNLSEYQNQSFVNMKYLLDQFNQPEYIPVLSEICSKMLVMCAENNLETSTKTSQSEHSQKRNIRFSAKRIQAYKDHVDICKTWRLQGRPQNADHPAKAAKIESQHKLQRIAREEETEMLNTVS